MPLRFSCEQTSKFISVQKMMEDMVSKLLVENSKNGLKKDGKGSFFLYLANTVPSADQVLSDLYNKHKNADGFLYLTYGELDSF